MKARANTSPATMPARAWLSRYENPSRAARERALRLASDSVEAYGCIPDHAGNYLGDIVAIAKILNQRKLAAAEAAFDETDKFLEKHNAPKTCGGSNEATDLYCVYIEAALVLGMTMGATMAGGMR